MGKKKDKKKEKRPAKTEVEAQSSIPAAADGSIPEMGSEPNF